VPRPTASAESTMMSAAPAPHWPSVPLQTSGRVVPLGAPMPGGSYLPAHGQLAPRPYSPARTRWGRGHGCDHTAPFA
jgi:hypothetical protein